MEIIEKFVFLIIPLGFALGLWFILNCIDSRKTKSKRIGLVVPIDANYLPYIDRISKSERKSWGSTLLSSGQRRV